VSDYPLTGDPYQLAITIKMPEGNLDPIGGKVLLPVILDSIRDLIKSTFGEVSADVQIKGEVLYQWTCKHCGKQHFSAYQPIQPWCCKKAKATWNNRLKHELEKEDRTANHIPLVP
jgi:hypothetical protein